MKARRRSSRREFLKGKSAADALADVVDRSLGDATEGGAATPNFLPGDRYLVRLARRAMACEFEMTLNAGQYPHDVATALAALDLVEQLEEQLSVFRPSSEICAINRQAGEQEVEVEERLFQLFELAKSIHVQTQGAYDITAGGLSAEWGFTRRAGAIPDPSRLQEALRRVGSQHLQLNRRRRSVRFLIPGLEINLGSIGKGYALDRCGEIFDQAGVHDVLLHGGHSSVLARGDHAGSPGQGWIVGVRNPLRPQRRLGEVRLSNRALATSGSGTQFFLHQGRRYGHLLDPRTGWPAEGVLSVTVAAPTAAEADALSTAFYVLGPKGAAEYCQSRPSVSFLLCTMGKREGSLTVHRAGWPDDDWRPAQEQRLAEPSR